MGGGAIRGVLGIGVAALLLAPAASAELYRCQDANGRTVFTDDPAVCPGARPSESTGRVQAVPSAPLQRSAPPARSSLQQQAEDAAETLWRQKKSSKEHELRELEARHADLVQYVTWCNRGGELIARDEAGLAQKVSCGDVDQEFAEVGQKLETVRHYLEEGIQEECRRAGCLPGWLR
jgi:hypothetical protein